MKFSIIGTGNMAWFFSKRIAAAGHSCAGVYGRDEKKAAELADALLAPAFGAIEKVRDQDADVCFLAVADDALEEVASKLSFKHTVLVHMAGAQRLDIIKAGAEDFAVLWPIYSVLRNNLPRHRDIPCAWEVSSVRAKRFALEMAHCVSDILFEADFEKRQWLHLSAVMTNNFINHLLSINEKICQENDLPANALQPLIDQTFERVKNHSPLTTQTGPAIRNDLNTIEKHLELLAKKPQLKKVYKAMTDSIQALHKQK